jgi:hypothetical protein
MKHVRATARVGLRGALVAALFTTVGALLPGLVVAAWADPYSSVAPSISDSSPTPGSSVNVSASGFQPNSTAQILLHSTPVLLATSPTDANGTVSATVTIPTDAALGAHDIVLSGDDSSGSAMSVSIPITVVAATTTSTGSGGGLAFTGADIALTAAVGLAAFGFGGFLLLSVRRKRRALEQ